MLKLIVATPIFAASNVREVFMVYKFFKKNLQINLFPLSLDLKQSTKMS
jgi:hypothetical protein